MAMTLPAGAAVICLAASGLPTARRIAGSLPGARVHGLAHRVGAADVAFTATVDHVAGLFAAGVPVIGVCATGILIRAVAPLLADKTNEPPLLAVTEDGASVIPLLGGHRGANRLARHLAAVTGGHAVTTTLGDVRHSRALDEMPCGWRLAAASLGSAPPACAQQHKVERSLKELPAAGRFAMHGLLPDPRLYLVSTFATGLYP